MRGRRRCTTREADIATAELVAKCANFGKSTAIAQDGEAAKSLPIIAAVTPLAGKLKRRKERTSNPDPTAPHRAGRGGVWPSLRTAGKGRRPAQIEAMECRENRRAGKVQEGAQRPPDARVWAPNP